MQACLLCLDYNLHYSQRRTTKFKETISSSNLVDLQDACKDVTEDLFCVIGRNNIFANACQFRIRQSLHIRLAVRRHWHLLQLEIGRGHHILRQTLGDFCLQVLRSDFTVSGIVGTEVLAVVDLSDQDDHLLHTLNLQHHILDLT